MVTVFMGTKPKILILVSYYLPGYKAGGPLRTIANLVNDLGDDFEFLILTRDRDLGDNTPYFGITVNEWSYLGKTHVFYASPEYLTFRRITKVINNTAHDVLYLNSFFDPLFSIRPLLARRFKCLVNTPVLLAPRGEFSSGALQLKSFKKNIYIYLSNFISLYKDIYWHASSEYEANDIKHKLPVADNNMLIALDLSTKISVNDLAPLNLYSDTLRVVFLSRISPKKNLDYALRVLASVKAKLIFDIYGPLEDDAYWQSCLELCNAMPKNITITYCGTVLPEEVTKTFASYDLFFFPTKGENYGHVIAESLSVGTPVLLSDQTPWQNLDTDGLGWSFSLDNMGEFVNILESVACQTQDQKHTMRLHIRQKIIARILNPDSLEANRQMFLNILKN